ncbi:MAG: hypothetical protein QOI63_1860 [Thermoplasmata archaeon]|jgi:FtsP/CotA-like multicopper oxidase with cupredoxin domain|nr:hypothetical protein [Thermoplasmata archaeon]
MIPRTFPVLALALLAATALAGCSGSGAYDPNGSVKETGRTVHLKMTVVDLLNTTVYPGLNANLWAFCAEPVDPSDTYSAAAIGYFTPLPGDAPSLGPDLKGKCSVPGPTLTVTQGDRVIVEFSHSHFHPHTIHWHGQYVPEPMDGVPGITQEAVQTGQAFTYDFIAKRAGTLWYHCHVDTHLHVMQGLYGLFIVKPQDAGSEPKADSEAVMVLGTMARNVVEAIPGVNPHAHPAGCFTSGKPDCQNPPIDSGAANVFLINGHSYPLTDLQEQSWYHVDAGKTLRIRILNAGETTEAIHLHGHDMLITHQDGVLLPPSARRYVDTVEIAPAQRFDVLIQGNNPGVWAFHTHVNAHEANDEQVPGGMHTMLVDGPVGDHAGHEFPSELPGGVGYQKPVYIPQSFSNATTVALGTTAPAGLPAPVPPTAATSGVAVDWAFPVEQGCAVSSFDLVATLSGATSASLSGTDLPIQVVAPDGSQRFSAHLGRDPDDPKSSQATAHWSLNASRMYGENTFAGLPPPDGVYHFQASGTAAQSQLSLSVHVNYWGSYDELRAMHRLHKYPLCGKYGQGTDGLETKAPPP